MIASIHSLDLEAARELDKFGVGWELEVTSAHRSPAYTAQFVREAEARGVQVFIAGAGMAAHLAGVMAAVTILPVIGVPIGGGALGGVDALYSTAQMPGGIPVATVTIGKAGAKNAGILAVQMLALSDENLSSRLKEFKETMAREIEEKDRLLQEKTSK